MRIREGLTFDDVLLVPRYSEISSRSEVDTSISLAKGFKFTHPIIPANMKTISGLKMAQFIIASGGLAILHRFMSMEEQLLTVQALRATCQNAEKYLAISIGVKEEDKNNLSKFINAGIKIVCIDIAHGDSKMCIDMCKHISKNYPDILLIAGNVATAEGARRLWLAGTDVVKIGIGPGSLCSTRIETGNGVPQLTALMDVAECRKSLNLNDRQFNIIADGGLKYAGDIVKGLCFADMVMAGNLFAGTEETPGKTLSIDGRLYKEYVGSSTHKSNHIEGVAALIPVKGHAKDILSKLLEGVRSGISYQGCSNLTELKEDPEFVRITGAGLKESHPHDVIIDTRDK